MQIVINMPEDIYNHIVVDSEYFTPSLVNAFKNGTPIPENATNGDVIKALFEPNWIRRMDDVVREEYEFDADWWNAPYQKGGKE